MGSSGKKRTTRAKLDREGKLRQRRIEKEIRKATRKLAAIDDASEPVFRSEEFTEDAPGLDDRPVPVDAGPEPAASVSHAASSGA